MIWFVMCSGEGAMAVIEANEQTGRTAAMVAAAVLLAAALAMCLRARRVRKSAIGLALLCVVNPGVWMGARHGDCGYFIRDYAWPVTIVTSVLAVAIVAITALKSRHGR